MKITEMSKEDFEKVPERTHFDEQIGLFNSLVILPMDYLHDSGYKCMDFVAVNEHDEPICKLSGCSDVLHLDGIGGYGKYDGRLAENRPIEEWSIDCLPCGLLRVFCNGWIEAGYAVSSFEIFFHRRDEKKITSLERNRERR